MNLGVGLLAVFCGALAGGIFVSNNQNQQELVKDEVVIKKGSEQIGEIGPCKYYVLTTPVGMFNRPTFTVVCPTGYSVSTTLLHTLPTD